MPLCLLALEPASAVSFDAGDTKVSIQGHVQADFIYDTDGYTRPLNVGALLPAAGPGNVNHGYNHVKFSARGSQIGFMTSTPTDNGTVTSFIDMDFWGDSAANQDVQSNGYAPRLRVATINWKGITAGQNWSNMMDLYSIPEVLNYTNANGFVYTRQTQIKYTHKTGDWTLEGALEHPELNGGNDGATATRGQAEILDATGTATGRESIPDMIVGGRYMCDWGHVRFQGMYRNYKVTNTGAGFNAQSKNSFSYGAAGRVHLNFWNKNNLAFAINSGKGLGHYVKQNIGSGLANNGAVVDANGDLHLLRTTAGYVAFQQWFTDKVRANVAYGKVNVSKHSTHTSLAAGQAARVQFQSWHVNVVTNLTKSLTAGLEYGNSKNKQADGTKGRARRFQAQMKYKF